MTGDGSPREDERRGERKVGGRAEEREGEGAIEVEMARA